MLTEFQKKEIYKFGLIFKSLSDWIEEGGLDETKQATKDFIIEHNKLLIKQIINNLDNNKEKWTLGLTYMADKELENQYKTSEEHLNIILNEIKLFLNNLIK